MELLKAAQVIEDGREYLANYAHEELNYRPASNSFDCPWCTQEHKPEGKGGFQILPNGKYWKCSCCGLEGDIYDLATAVEGISWPSAVDWIAYKYGWNRE